MDMNLIVDRKLDQISKKLSFTDLNPVNVEEEKERFFRSESYNPVFEYGRPSCNLDALSVRLERLRPDDSPVGNILRKIRDLYLLDISLINSRGLDGFQGISDKIYGKPDASLVKHAKRLAYLKIRPEENKYSTKQIINKLNLAFIKYGFHWEVEEKDMVANAAVKIQEKKLLIKKSSRFSSNFLKRIIVHEIGTHIMRAENGENQPYRFFARGFPGYLMTEEGLAVYNEEANDCLNNFVLKIYAGRVIAIDYAMQKSFSDTYSMLRKYFTKNTGMAPYPPGKEGFCRDRRTWSADKGYRLSSGIPQDQGLCQKRRKHEHALFRQGRARIYRHAGKHPEPDKPAFSADVPVHEIFQGAFLTVYR